MIISADRLVKIGHWHYNIAENHLYWSKEIRQLHGIKRHPSLREGIHFIKKGEHRRRFRRHIKQALERGKPFNVEVKTVSEYGNEYWLRIWGAPQSENGKTISIYGGTQEITERKSRLDRLSRVATETQNAVIITDTDRRILWINRAFEKLTGYTSEEVTGRNPGDFLQGDESDEDVIQYMRKKLNNEEAFSSEIINYTKEGQPYWTKIDVSPIRNEDGEIVEFFSIQEEITQKKEAEQALKDEHDRLLFAQRVGKIGDWEYNPKSGEMRWSPMMYRIFGRPEKPGAPKLDSMSRYFPKDSEKLKSAFRRAVHEQVPFAFDTEINNENGNRKFLYIEGIPKTKINGNSQDQQVRGICQDITARKLARNRMVDREKQLRSTVNNIKGVLIRYQLLPSGEDRIIYVSEGAEKVFGLNRRELLRSPSAFWQLLHPDDIDEAQRTIKKSAEELSIWNHIFRIYTPEDGLKWIHGRGAPERLYDGTTQWDTLILDATDSVQRERMNDALLQEVHHRVKNNLAIIIALIQMELIDVDEDQLNRLPLERTATRIYSLSQVHEMLYGHGDLGSVNSDDYFKKLVNMVKDTIRLESEIDVKVETNGICLNVNELSPLGMLVNELLTNSMKGAVDKRDARSIEIRLEKEEDQYCLVYRDSGPGISKEQYENVETTGMKIIHILLDQLRADRELLDPPGFGLKITFKHIERGAHGVEFLSEL